MISSEKKEASLPPSLKLKLKWGWKWKWDTHGMNEQGYRLQHQHFQERPTINKKKTLRAQRPVCSVSKLMNYPNKTPPQKNCQLKSSPKPTQDEAP